MLAPCPGQPRAPLAEGSLPAEGAQVDLGGPILGDTQVVPVEPEAVLSIAQQRDAAIALEEEARAALAR